MEKDIIKPTEEQLIKMRNVVKTYKKLWFDIVKLDDEKLYHGILTCSSIDEIVETMKKKCPDPDLKFEKNAVFSPAMKVDFVIRVTFLENKTDLAVDLQSQGSYYSFVPDPTWGRVHECIYL